MQGNELLAAAVEAAREAAAVHRTHLGQVRVEDWSEKGIADFVTHVDRAAEAGIIARIRSRFPDHAVLAEEEASVRAGAAINAEEWTWIVDPLDGTTNYLHSYPMYAVSIAAAHRGVVEAACVLNSASGEEWTAVRGGGAFLNGQRARVSQIDLLPRALIGTGFPFKAIDVLPEYTRQFEAVVRATAGVRRAGAAALDLCHVASGWFDGFWELSLAPWDIAAGALLVREAGGMVTRLDGDDDILGHGAILAGNPAIHEQLGALLQRVERTRVNVA
ncbi:MAG TPA: inositol monophosphatase family protein [Longimicrobiales bacterium]|nr:inositol monophosphatase family protein [Longimicrobiales bacterium]